MQRRAMQRHCPGDHAKAKVRSVGGLEDVLHLGCHDRRGAEVPAQRALSERRHDLAVVSRMVPVDAGRDESLEIVGGLSRDAMARA